MAEAALKGAKPTSDESNSTEHDATVSLSGTDEMNEIQSVLSDSLSKASRTNDAKKVIQKLNKLREENLLLKEALEKANATDITMLKTKLRGNHADMVRLRQNNLELKDRIQVLEERLFNALSAHTKTGWQSTDTVPTVEGPVLMAPLPSAERGASPTNSTDSRFTSSERAHLMDNIRSLQARCKHLARLVQSYESKITILQAEVDLAASRSTENTQKVGSSDAPAPAVGFSVVEADDSMVMRASEDSQLSNMGPLKSALKGSVATVRSTGTENASRGKKKVKMQQSDVEAQIQKAREADAKLIRELSEEVKRLVALLPRQTIEQTEGQEQGQGQVQEEPSHDPHSPREGSADEQDAVMGTDAVASKGAGSTAAAAVGGAVMEAALSSKARKIGGGSGNYGPSEVLCSFLAGVLVMLLCVALSGHWMGMGLSSRDTTDPRR